MKSLNIGAERAPLVWVLVGLLMSTSGLFLGFEYFPIFGYLAIGFFCIVFGVALGVLRLRERPSVSTEKRLSPNFVSAGATRIMKAMSASEHAVVKDKTDSAPA
jgi:membrane-bound ClpP family serine protease